MLDVELQRLRAAVLVDHRRIHRAYPRRHRLRLLKTYALEGDRAAFQRELEMLISHDALRRDLELVAETRRRKSLSPDSLA